MSLETDNLLSSFASHQVPLPNARTDATELAHLEKWLRSYEPEKLFNFSESASSIVTPLLTASLPVDVERRLGFIKEADRKSVV